MIDFKKELQTRQLLKDAIARYLDENEKEMPLLDGLLSYVNKQNSKFEQTKALLQQSPQLTMIINAMLNENLTFMQALIKYIGVDFATVQEGSVEYYEILNAEIERNEKESAMQDIQNQLRENQILQTERIEAFCKENGLNIADFIEDLDNFIIKPIINCEITYKDLIAYKIAIDATKFFEGTKQSTELFAERKPKITTNACIYHTSDGITYFVHSNGKLEILPIDINPQEPMYKYIDLFATGVKKEYPNKWNEIKELLEHTNTYERIKAEKTRENKEINENDIIISILKACSEVPYFGKTVSENEKRLKPMSIDVDKITMLSKMKALKKAYNIFWETVAKIYHLADIKDIDAFKNCTLNDTILPLND